MSLGMSQSMFESYVKANLPSQREASVDINIVKNQNSPYTYELMAISTVLKSNPQFVVCPYCKAHLPTRTERELSFKNTICCIFSGPVFWGIFQILKNKDLNCYDARHYCLKCNANLMNYQAC